MLAALDAGADDVVDDGGRLAGHVRAVASSTTCSDALEAAGFEVESAETHDGVGNVDRGHRRRGGAQGPADRRRARGQRRRAGRLLQLRHQRRADGDGRRHERRCRGDRAPAFTLARHRRGARTRWPTTPASRWCSSSIRATTRRCAPSSSTPTTTTSTSSSELDAQVLGISAQDVESHEKFSGKHGFEFPLLADTDKAVAGAVRHARADGFPRRSASDSRIVRRRAGAEVSAAVRHRQGRSPACTVTTRRRTRLSTPQRLHRRQHGVIRYAHRAIAGLTYRPVSELVEVLSSL